MRWVIEDGQQDRDAGVIFDSLATTFWTADALSTLNERPESAIPRGTNIEYSCSDVPLGQGLQLILGYERIPILMSS